MKNDIVLLSQGTEQEWADRINQHYAPIKDRLNQAVKETAAFGAYLVWVKEEGKRTGLIPHGEFGPWMEKNCPDLPFRTAQSWMELGTRAMKVLFPQDQKRNVALLAEVPFWELLTLSENELPEGARKKRKEADLLFDGKSKKQLMFRFNNFDLMPGGFRPSSKEVAKWLAEKHPDFDGTPYTDLPEELQAEFRELVAAGEAAKGSKKRTKAQMEAERLKLMAVAEELSLLRHLPKVLDNDLLRRFSREGFDEVGPLLNDLHNQWVTIRKAREAKASKKKQPLLTAN